jgi:hypothetical protein
MAFAVGIKKLAQVEMRILLGRGQALMAQELLDGSQVRAASEKMGSERMAQRMGADPSQ